jgi:hypothetical protein
MQNLQPRCGTESSAPACLPCGRSHSEVWGGGWGGVDMNSIVSHPWEPIKGIYTLRSGSAFIVETELMEGGGGYYGC